MPHADVAEGIHHTFTGENAVCGDEFFDQVVQPGHRLLPPRAALHPATYMPARKAVNSATALTVVDRAALPIELFPNAAKALVSLARRRAMAENPVPVCAVADVQSGGVKSFEVGGERVAVYNIGGTFYATEACCTHAMADLGDGILEGDVIECSLHFGAFHVPSGTAVQPPCDTDLRTFRTEVRDGQL